MHNTTTTIIDPRMKVVGVVIDVVIGVNKRG